MKYSFSTASALVLGLVLVDGPLGTALAKPVLNSREIKGVPDQYGQQSSPSPDSPYGNTYAPGSQYGQQPQVPGSENQQPQMPEYAPGFSYDSNPVPQSMGGGSPSSPGTPMQPPFDQPQPPTVGPSSSTSATGPDGNGQEYPVPPPYGPSSQQPNGPASQQLPGQVPQQSSPPMPANAGVPVDSQAGAGQGGSAYHPPALPSVARPVPSGRAPASSIRPTPSAKSAAKPKCPKNSKGPNALPEVKSTPAGIPQNPDYQSSPNTDSMKNQLDQSFGGTPDGSGGPRNSREVPYLNDVNEIGGEEYGNGIPQQPSVPNDFSTAGTSTTGNAGQGSSVGAGTPVDAADSGVTSTPPPDSNIASGDDKWSTNPADMKKALLDAHNSYRMEHDARELEWDDNLAADSQQWSQNIACSDLQHSQGNNQYGENIAAQSASPSVQAANVMPSGMTPGRAVQAFVEERSKHQFEVGGFSFDTGHFTQVVWKQTTRVGCGAAKCAGTNFWTLTCRYTPPGNVQGQFQHNVKPKKET